ncbi:RHS repeat domain-containing protein [Tenacibaculum maritimum]|uniref:RHS repeat domain-containing protein n=1 Tax=Tenacibaculum maritimum TaxID=107401 RepID=UPI0038770BCD
MTWVYESGRFVPSAKLVGTERYSILSDYLGTPIQAYDAKGNIVWECELDIYGKVGNLHGEKTFIPFRYQGQYEDIETGVYYNRFRYYSPDTGTYISKDPIGLRGNNPNFYAYVKDSNFQVDIFGLAGTPWLPHGASQPDVISKGPHFYAGDGKTELKLKLDGNGKVDFEEVFTKDSGTSKLNKAIKESREKLLKDKNWREKLLKNAGEVKNSLFNAFDRLDRAREVKKIEKALKKICK